MRLLDLFAGIGGFSLAAHWMGWQTAAFVEWDKYCQKVLKKNFPNVPIYGDIREFDGTQYRGAIDIICGGFPCQPFSSAGKREGTADDRYLWPKMLRVITEVRPAWVVGENVAGILSMDGGKVFEEVCTSLEVEGYVVEPFVLPAISKGAPHRRDRVWIVANSISSDAGLSPGTLQKENQGERLQQEQRMGKFGGTGEAYGFAANTNSPAEPKTIDRRQKQKQNNGREIPNFSPASDRTTFTDSNGKGLEKREGVGSDPRTEQSAIIGTNQQNTSNTQGIGWSEGQRWSEWLFSDLGERYRGQWAIHWYEVATRLCRMDDGLPAWMVRHRTNRLKALGNSISPYLAYELYQAIEKVNSP